MLFRRRKPAGFREKLRELVWPRKGGLRSLRYLQKRILRLRASPHAIAAGVAVGACVSWTPFIGFHFIMAFVLAYFVAGNLVAAALGCAAFGNPLTYPFIWGLTWEMGHLILGSGDGNRTHGIDLPALFEKLDLSQLWGPILEPMLIGAIPFALFTGVIVYVILFYAISRFQMRRRARRRPGKELESVPTV